MQISKYSVISLSDSLVRGVSKSAQRHILDFIDFQSVIYKPAKLQLQGILLVFLSNNGVESCLLVKHLQTSIDEIDSLLEAYRFKAECLPPAPDVHSASTPASGAFFNSPLPGLPQNCSVCDAIGIPCPSSDRCDHVVVITDFDYEFLAGAY